MTSLPIRNQLQDQLLTPRNSALLIIDYQPVPLSSITSMDSHELVTNIVGVAKTAKLFGLPIVLSTGDVKTGRNQPTIPQLIYMLDVNTLIVLPCNNCAAGAVTYRADWYVPLCTTKIYVEDDQSENDNNDYPQCNKQGSIFLHLYPLFQ
jgi:nicotinamidase-related amidase